MTLILGIGVSSTRGSTVTKKPSPDAVVANLYKQHKKRSPFFQTRSRALLDEFFEKNLANLIWKDAVTSKGEVGALDFDPLYNAQDTDIKNFVIHKPAYREGKAEVLVSFENFGEKQRILFDLVSQKTGWKIANINYGKGSNLLGMLQSNFASTQPNSEVKIYLVAVGDNGKRGKKTGCDDSLVPVTRRVSDTGAPLRAALQELLSMPPEPVDSPGLQNFWKGRNLNLRSVSIQKQTATILISGEVFVAGICDEPRIVGQIEETARQFPNVKNVTVFIGKRTLAEAIR
jgi:hypothetical protein